MQARLHLNVVQAPHGSQAPFLASSERNDFVWGPEGTSFRIYPLKWWDDQSYIDFELDGFDTAHLAEEEYQAEQHRLNPPPPAPPAAAPRAVEQDFDEIPF